MFFDQTRAVYIPKNQRVGQWSPIYTETAVNLGHENHLISHPIFQIGGNSLGKILL